MKVLSELDKAGKRIDELHTYLEQRDADIKSLRALASDMAQALKGCHECWETKEEPHPVKAALAKYKAAIGEGGVG